MTTTSQGAGPDEGARAPATTPDPSSTAQPPPAADPVRLTSRLRVILAIVLLADVLDLMDSTITNIAAPPIVRDIGGGESLIKWLGAGYALAMGVLLVVGGRLGDRYGKRRMFLTGIAGFTVASLWCGLSVDPAMLIAGRLIQGGFGALLIPQGIGILLGTFSREQLPRVFSAFGPVMGASAGGHDRLLQPAGPARRRARHDRERRRRRRDRRPVPRPRLAAPQVSPKEQH